MESPKVGKIGKYEVLEVLGKGGMGLVYKATDPAIGRLVAIKVITTGLDKNPSSLKRFYREAQSTGKLQHQNIVIVHELGEQDGTPFLVMEFLEGESLQSLISARRRMPLLDKLGLIIQTCHGLQYAHEHHIVHRDIKPGNLMLLKDGLLKIVDFGIARIGNESVTLPGQVLGSIYYMSPEQFTGTTVDSRTDIFSTGVVLYELLTFTLPFQGKDISSTLQKISNDPPPPLQQFLGVYPPDLDSVLQRALAKSRTERYQTAEDFGFELGQVQDQLKRELASEYQRVAEDLMARSEFSKAKEQVLQILRMDRQNRRANELLKELTRRINIQERDDHVRHLRTQAEVASADGDVDRALQYLDQAVTLVPEDSELQQMRAGMREGKLRREKAVDALRRAESAQWAGELDEALAAIEEARSLGAEPSMYEAMHSTITREIDDRNRRRELQGALDEAQRKMSSRNFTDAINVLRKAEAIDPEATAVKELLALASNLREQERRRKELEQRGAEIQDALNHDDYRTASEKAASALELFPGERALVKLKALADKQLEASERRSFVEGQIATARTLLEQKQTERALGVLESAATRFPTEPALLSLLTAVRESLKRERAEQSKREYIHRAKEALRLKKFEEATAILEIASAELDAPEIDDLLQFAKDEAVAHKRQQILDAAAQEAHRLMAAGCFEDVINFLKSILRDISDEELEITLADAQRQLAELNRRVKDAIEAGERLLNAGRVVQAVRYLESQAPVCGSSTEFRAIVDRAHHEQDRLQAVDSAVQKARAALDRRDFATAADAVETCKQEVGEYPELLRMQNEIVQHRQDSASEIVSKAITDLRMLLLGRSYAAAVELHGKVAGVLDLVPADVRERYNTLHEDAERGLQRAQSISGSNQASDVSHAPDGNATEQQFEWGPPSTSDDATILDNSLQQWPQLNLSPETVAGSLRAGAMTQQAEAAGPIDNEATVVMRPGSQREATARALEFSTAPQPVSTPQTRPQLRPVQPSAGGKKYSPLTIALVALGLVIIVGLVVWVVYSASASGATHVAVHSTPEGAAVQVMDSTCITPNCKLDLPPGTYKIAAKLRGYASKSQTIQIERGKKPANVDFALEPLRPVLRLNANFTNSSVKLDGRDLGSPTNGQIEISDLSPGDHYLKLASSNGDAELRFTTAPAQAPVVIRPIQARQLSVLLVSTVSGSSRVDCNCAGAQQLGIDGRSLGDLTDAGRDLGDLGQGVHELQVGAGDEKRTQSLKLGEEPALDVFVNAVRNVGTLVVDSNVSDADVFVNGKRFRYGTVTLRIPLDANEYSVRMQKDGYEPATQAHVDIRKNQDRRIAFQLTPQDKRAYIAIRGGVPGASVRVDGTQVGVVGGDGVFYSPAEEPGEHVIQMSKNGYETRSIEAPVGAGEILNISGEQARLQRSGQQTPEADAGANANPKRE